MSDFDGGHCPDCGGSGGSHFPGCDFDGTGRGYGGGGYRKGGGGMSNFKAAMCVIGSFIGTAAIFAALDVDFDNTPVVLFIIVWIVVAAVVAVVADR